jgi:hypothetical protein
MGAYWRLHNITASHEVRLHTALTEPTIFLLAEYVNEITERFETKSYDERDSIDRMQRVHVPGCGKTCFSRLHLGS